MIKFIILQEFLEIFEYVNNGGVFMKSIMILIILLAYIYVILKSKNAMHMLQQNLYNMNQRYLKWILKNLSAVFLKIDILAVFCFGLAFFFNQELWIYGNILIYLGGIFLVQLHSSKEKIQTKKPLVITARVKRLLITTSILYLLPVILCYYMETQKTFLLLILGLMIYFNYFILWFTNIINKPVEKCVYYYYYFHAVRKLKTMSQLKIVGITGSYGKTSSKNILSDILNVKMIAHPTPKNLNTEYGLMMTINNHLDKFDEVFIAEMGAYQRGEIATLCKMIHPKYAILTTIGTAHLETFRSEENIQKTKFELVESLSSDGIAILNGDDPKQLSYSIQSDCQKIWIGIDNHEVDIYADNIRCSKDGSTFDCYFKNQKKPHTFTTKLLGNHNIYNILASIALALEFGMNIEEIKQGVRKVRPIEHRLEIKQVGMIHMIDDAYNSNPVGAKRAVEVLAMMKGTKVVVTPGMIELGVKEKEYNKIFGMQIANVADYVVLIGEKRTKPIYDGLIESGYNKDKIYILNDVKESFTLVASFKGKEDIYALYENDLPDSYNETKK